MTEPEPTSPHIRKLIEEKLYAVTLTYGWTVDSEKAYAYVAMPMGKLEGFVKAQQQSGTFKPGDHGTILASGTGEPPETVKRRMAEEFGFNHKDMVVLPLPDAVKAYANKPKNP